MKKWFPLVFFFAGLLLQSQALPPIKSFQPKDYGGENQNWSITQGYDGHIYIANNHNLLDYNGVEWTKYTSPNASIFRAVASNDSLIFSGQYMEFGYWKKNSVGRLEYTSISSKMEAKMIDDEEFWNISILDDWILFQSLDRIYSYNLISSSFKLVEAKSEKAHLFNIHGTVYFQNQNLGLYRIENGASKLVADHEAINNSTVVGMYAMGKEILLIMENGTFFILSQDGVSPWDKEKKTLPEDLSIYSTTRLEDGSFILGTISHGIFQIGESGSIVRNIDQLSGLNNNTVLHAFQDKEKNLWLGLDNGLSVINLDSPFNEFRDNSGKLGLVYASREYNNRLYLGTNQGLFVNSGLGKDDFKIIKGTDGQVWSLSEFHGALFCGHNKGTFLIKQEEAQLISNLPGTWIVKEIQGKENLLIQGNYDGLSVLQKEGNQWSLSNKIKGFSISSRFVEVLSENKILVNHEYKGLYELSLDSNFSRIIKKDSLPIMGYGSSLARYQDEIVYTSLEGAFTKDKKKFTFSPDSTLLKLLFEKSGGVTSIAIPDKPSQRLWCFTPSGLSYVQPQTFSNALELKTIPIPSFFKGSLGVSGFENLTPIGSEKYIIGMSNGFVELNLANLEDFRYSIEIQRVNKRKGLEDAVLLDLNSFHEMESSENTISFSYSVPQYKKYTEVDYQYRLVGLFDQWSPFTKESSVTFNNLNFGTYTFEVKAEVGNTQSDNIASYSFKIKRPWYLSWVAILIYALAFGLLFFSIHKAYKRYYTQKQKRLLDLEKRKQKRKKLKSEKELIKLRNDKLRAEVDSKNRELAAATMSMIKKNEFLNAIKSQLHKASDANNEIKSVIRTIDKNLNNTDDWKFFEEAFNNADKNFMKKVKEAHPNLTPNDLKICAYLRLNLSSKEIAPLLNISLRSVEVKRYRLRKKMNLSHESSLVEYIMTI